MQFHGLVILWVLIGTSLSAADDTVLWKASVDRLTVAIQAAPQSEDLYSQRGDAHFFLAEYAKAVADYDQMVKLNAGLDAGHWRRGIALFYAGESEQAAGQFERYHSFDNVDRENGIWRYLCQRQAFGLEKAREGLLKYEKDDREPFGDVYRLFEGKITGDELLDKIRLAKISEAERQKRLFYAELYVGLNESVEGRADSAKQHLTLAAGNTWGQKAGYGPNYMWHVARLHAAQLAKPALPQNTQP